MKSVMIITLLAAMALAVSAELEFPSPDYYGGYQISVGDADTSKMWLPSDVKEIMNKDRSPAKDIYNQLYIPLGVATEAEKPLILRKLLSAMSSIPVPVGQDGYRLYLIGTRDVGSFKRYLYTTEQGYNLYAKV